ncbi:MAG: hypothetical protein HKN88_01240 [Gammaproteobacteria bacterium]|nr:hypothetical protein [Gammaproteobacteria bacterium]NNC96673.1 hypothetical protein [Gammaproteobacteria bacterium]NNM13223.1 hypothetical protein [Gammaproteobacteria bacterium]
MMQVATEIKMIGIDSERPPIMSDKPYIDLVFELSMQTTKQWNEDFLRLFKNSKVSPKIDEADNLFIQTWTRNMEEIPQHVELLKAKILECNQIALDRQVALDLLANAGSKVTVGVSAAQAQLNDIIAGLNF